MVNTTTTKDLARKIEWVGLRSLSGTERERVAEELFEVSCYLPQVLAHAVYRFFGETAPDHLITRSADSSLRAFHKREEARRFVREVMAGYREDAEEGL